MLRPRYPIPPDLRRQIQRLSSLEIQNPIQSLSPRPNPAKRLHPHPRFQSHQLSLFPLHEVFSNDSLAAMKKY